jgi:signal transduction histidine kinase
VWAVRRVLAVIGWFTRRPVWVADGLLALLVGYAENVTVAQISSTQVFGPLLVPPAGAVAVALAATVPLAARRLAPVPVVAVTVVGSLVEAYLRMPSTGIATMVAVYTVAAHRPRREAFAVAAVALACFVVALTAVGRLEFLVADTVLMVAVTALGDRTRAARERALELEERARELVREREERLRLAVTAERTRIARELHDITAHGVAVIAVQAAGARRVVHADPDRAAEALREIEETARDGLTQMRQAVSLLREGAPDAAPQPGLTELAGLIARFRDAGLRVDAQLPDPEPGFGPAVGLTVYRTVQEALTNTLRHAGRTRARVRVDAGSGEVRVLVHDDGPVTGAPPPPAETSGYGLVGLRERVRSHGGELTVRHGDGHRLEARIPLDDRAPVPAGTPT